MRNSQVGKLLGVFALICALVLIMAPAAFADSPVGGDRIFNGRTGALDAVAAPASAEATTAGLAEAWVATTGDDTTGDGSQSLPFKTIQKGLDSVAVGGTVYVYPGTYDETAADRLLFDGSASYQFGLFFADEKGAVTLQGVTMDGTPITAVADVAATVNTNATNNYGPSGFWVEGDGVTIAGIRIGTNSAGQNKTVEVIGENFTLKNCDVADTGGSIYLNDWRFNGVANESYMMAYRIEGNTFASGASLDIASGPGVTGPVSGRVITGNSFASADGDYWPPISFSGADSDVPWFTFSVGGAVITGNTFTNADPTGQYIRARGTYVEAQFDWASYWNDNTFDKGVVVTTDGDPANVRTYSYPNDYGTFNNVRRIGAIIQGEVDHAVAGDTVLVGPGTFVENVALNKAITLKGANAGVAGGAVRGPESVVDANLVSAAFALGADDIVIDGFKIQRGGGALGCGIHAPGAYAGYAIRNNIITGNVMGIYANSAGASVIENNWIDANNEPGSAGGSGIYGDGGDVNLSITGNKITGHTENNPVIFAATAASAHTGLVFSNNLLDNSYGVYALKIVNGTISGNTIRTAGFTAFGLADGSVNVDFLNNDFSNNDRGLRIRNDGYGWGAPADVEAHGNDFANNPTYGLEIMAGAYAGTLNADNNWWGTPCEPSAKVSGLVDYTPWWGDATGSFSLTANATAINAGDSAAEQMAVMNCAAPGATITYPFGTYPGGIVVTNNNITIDLGGATVGAGSPAYTIVGDDITLQNGSLDGTGDVDNAAGVLVTSGADNFTLNAVEVKNWRDGVEVAGSHASLKLVNNWLHDNSEDGFQFNSDVALSGVITINGNLFKFNGGSGIRNGSTLEIIPAMYNSWGDIDGPAVGTGGDGVSANVTATPFSFVELFTDAAVTAKNVVEGDTFNVQVLADAVGLYAVQYKLTYDSTLLLFQGITGGAFGSCTTNTATAGVITAYCPILNGAADVNALASLVNTITFKVQPDISHAGQDSWTTYLDLVHNDGLAAAARDGIKVWVNNGGFGGPSSTDKDITDNHDGTITIAGLAQYTGYIDLQGRTNDSGALLSVYDQSAVSAATLKATGTSAPSGAYLTTYAALQQLSVGTQYYFQVDRDLYLPTTRTYAPAGTDWAHFKLLSDRPNTVLGTVVLLGGDATNDNAVDVLDAGAIGGAYGTVVTCGAGACTDVTGDGKVDILDLTLMGGNYNKFASPWVE